MENNAMEFETDGVRPFQKIDEDQKYSTLWLRKL
jgi:hypothetical protein